MRGKVEERTVEKADPWCLDMAFLRGVVFFFFFFYTLVAIEG